jgi:Rrf2 family protein
MVRLNRTTEYGLMALRYMSRKSDCTSAREVADAYGLPFEITAKTLLRLKDLGIIQSTQGVHGGYTLQCSMKDITLARFLEMMEGPQFLVSCSSELGGLCDLNARMSGFLSGICLSELMSEVVES